MALSLCSQVIYFGYVTLFAAAFPLAPFLAMLLLQIEMRVDAFTILHSKHPGVDVRARDEAALFY